MYEHIKHIEEEMPGVAKEIGKELGEKEQLEKILPITLDGLGELCQSDPELEKLFERMVYSFCEYFKTLIDLKEVEYDRETLNLEEYQARHQRSDEAKRIIHDGLITDINALAMTMKMKGIDNAWIVPLRPGGDTNRAAYGRFALISIYLKLLEYEQ